MDPAQPRTRADDPSTPAHEQASEPGEDPFSPGFMLETGSSLFGAVIALLALSVPIGGVVADRLSLPTPTMAGAAAAVAPGHPQASSPPKPLGW